MVLHHSASWTDNYQSIKNYHMKDRGWRDAAYHLILSNGSTDVPLGYLEATDRYRSLSYSVATKSIKRNLHGLHLCIVGNYHEREVPKKLRASLAYALMCLQRKYKIPDERILFHRECSPSVCPGKYITKAALKRWMNTEAQRCPPLIKKQHHKVIGSVQYSIHSFPQGPLLFGFFVSLSAISLWIVIMNWRYTKSVGKTVNQHLADWHSGE
jgi:hypothetical protein